MNSPIDLTIVVPAFQEEQVIDATLTQLKKYIDSELKDVSTEVIVVTADSKDKTAKIVRRHSNKFKNFKFIEPGPKVGKGRDVREGMMKASGNLIIFTDADLATPLHHVREAIDILKHGETEIVIGVRDLSNIHTGARKIVSLGGNLLTRIAIDRSIKDTQCGFKGFTHNSAKDIFGRLKKLGWDFDIEVIAIARSRGYNIYHKRIDDWKENKPEDQQLVGESTIKASLKTLLSTLGIAYSMRTKRYGSK